MFDPVMERLFREVLDDMSAESAEYTLARERAERLACVLQNAPDIGVLGGRLSGSVGKQTALAPNIDIDMVLYLHGADWQGEDGRWLPPDEVLSSLHERVSRVLTWQQNRGYLEVHPNHRSLSVRYHREGSVPIDLVPILVSQGKREHGWIPDTEVGGYRTTSIERQFWLLDTLDGPQRPVRGGIRLLKLWARARESRPLKSYALEVLGLYAAANGAPRTPGGIFWWVLDQLDDGLLNEPVHIDRFFELPDCADEVQVFDPADEDSNLTSSLTSADAEAIAADALDALRHLRKAERARRRHGQADVEEHLAAVFGPLYEEE